MNRLSLAPLLLALPPLAPGSLPAQDPVVVDPAHYTLEFENDRVRVIRIRYGPGEGSVMHYHRPYVGVFLSDGRAQFELPGGRVAESSWKAGRTSWSEAELHRPQNTGDAPFELIAVELKDPASPTAADEASLRQVLQRFERAWNARDAEAIARLFREDGDQIVHSRSPHRGREAIQQFWGGLDSMSGPGRRIALDVVSTRFVDADVALVDARGNFSGGTGAQGRPLGPATDRATYVLTRDAQGWRISALRVYTAEAPAR